MFQEEAMKSRRAITMFGISILFLAAGSAVSTFGAEGNQVIRRKKQS